MNIITERLTITDLTIDMAQVVHENSLDEENRKYVPDEVFETVEEARETVEFLISQYDTDDGPLVHPIITKEGDNVGYVQLAPIDEGWEIGYHIAAQYRGRGYATEATEAFLPVMAKQKNIPEIYGICLAENVASIKIMDKLGFEDVFIGEGEYQGEFREIVKKVWKVRG